MGSAKPFDFAVLLSVVRLSFARDRSKWGQQRDISKTTRVTSTEPPPAALRRMERLDAILQVCASSVPPGA